MPGIIRLTYLPMPEGNQVHVLCPVCRPLLSSKLGLEVNPLKIFEPAYLQRKLCMDVEVKYFSYGHPVPHNFYYDL